MNKLVLFLIGSFGLLITACQKDKPVPQPEPVAPINKGQTVWVVNEGNFQSGNASITWYNTYSLDIRYDYYKNQNATDLGDVAQSMIRNNNKYYIVVNNSGKVVVCDTNLKKTTEITGLTSPRYMLPVSTTKAYISDLSSNSIHIIDLASHTKQGAIACQGWTEQMVLASGKAFVCNVRKNFVYVINPSTDVISDSINVGINAYSIVSDKNGKVWVLSGGDNANAIPARITRINAVTNSIEQSFNFPLGQSPSNLCINGSKDKLFFINAGIQSLDINTTFLTSYKVVYTALNYYGLAINPKTGDIFASDALDYIQRSKIYVYESDGTPKGSFLAGINANGFCFD
jgi:hypothetical protein